jgi:CHASE2 domain-containing sensor protein
VGDEKKKIMSETIKQNTIEQIINRRSTIKAIGWTMLVFAGITTYELAWSIIGLLGANPLHIEQTEPFNHEMESFVRNAAIIIVGLFLVSLVFSICAIGMLKWKRWAVLVFHALSLVLIIVIFGLLIYVYIMPTDTASLPANEIHEMFGLLMQARTGIFFMIVLWVITRVNILLYRYDYRKEFR